LTAEEGKIRAGSAEGAVVVGRGVMRATGTSKDDEV